MRSSGLITAMLLAYEGGDLSVSYRLMRRVESSTGVDYVPRHQSSKGVCTDPQAAFNSAKYSQVLN